MANGHGQLSYADMRLIGHLSSEHSARIFGDYLYVQGIENHVEDQHAEGWAVWVSDEDKLERATDLLAAFRQNPDDSKYRAEAKSATALRAEEEKSLAAYRKKLQDRRHLFRPLTPYSFGPLTFGLIALSVTVFVLTYFLHDQNLRSRLSITDLSTLTIGSLSLPEIRHGQLWRLFTPMFIHFDPLHIIFNMLWLRDLGSMIEARQSTWHLLILVLVIAAFSNLAQCYFQGPFFGGMSGVVYGLLGYIWIRGKRDPGSGLFLHQSTVLMMIVWFILCWSPFMPPIANWAHTAGLALGMAWGYFSSLKYR